MTISWADSIIIWSHSIIKLTPAQFKLFIYLCYLFFFKILFSFHCRTGSWHKGLGMKIGHTLLTHSPTSSSQAPASLGQREPGRRNVEKRANLFLFNWFWPQLFPHWLFVLWKQTLNGLAFSFVWHPSRCWLSVSARTHGFLGWLCRDSHCMASYT